MERNEVQVSTQAYESAHGFHPGMVRGGGTWVFFPDADQALEGQCFEVNADWSTALDAAIEWAEELGLSELVVGS